MKSENSVQITSMTRIRKAIKSEPVANTINFQGPLPFHSTVFGIVKRRKPEMNMKNKLSKVYSATLLYLR